VSDTLISPKGTVLTHVATMKTTPEKNNAAKAVKVTLKRKKYFVIHSTGGELSKKSIEGYKGHQGKAHAYIMRDGEMINIIDFNQDAWATKREKQDKSLIGLMYHIELNYAEGESPSKPQYSKLAEIFKQLNTEAAKYGDNLVIVPHKEVDRGVKNGHSDPENFDFNYFYEVLKGQGVEVDKINKITQDRYSIPNRADQKSNWPPVLSGAVARE
jgi:N-acetyl-anhydromuramyl-L-alanine amidase AmpD